MGEKYDRAVALDRGIADRWKQRTRENLEHRLTPGDVDYILGPVFRPGAKITENQGKALYAILEPPTKFTAAGTNRLRFYLNKAKDSYNLNLVHLDNDADLAPIYNALANDVVSRIIFKSPGTGITYAPFDYLAIRNLIASKRIAVYESRLGGLSKVVSAAGMYRSNLNRLLIYEFNDPVIRTMTIVHESTHAIQDWKDDKSLIHHRETDAFIAESVVELTLRRGVSALDIDYSDEAVVAARLVIEKRTDSKEWFEAYKKAVDAIGKTYKLYGIRSDPGKEELRESEIYKQVQSAAEISQMLWEMVKRSSDESRKLVERVDLGKYVLRPAS